MIVQNLSVYDVKKNLSSMIQTPIVKKSHVLCHLLLIPVTGSSVDGFGWELGQQIDKATLNKIINELPHLHN